MNHKEIKIGALYPLTGDNAAIGKSIHQALDFYIDLVNYSQDEIFPEFQSQGLKGLKIKLIWADTEGDPLVAVSKAKRLIRDEGVSSIIGSYQSNVTAAVSLQTEFMNIPYLSPDTDAQFLTQRGLKWFFRTGQTDVINTRNYFELLEGMGYHSSTAGALSENSSFGQDEVQAMLNLSYCYKFKATVLELYDPEFPVTARDILPIRSANPDFLFAAQFQDDIVETIKIMKEIDYHPQAIFYQTSTLTFDEVLKALGRNADYIFSASAWTDGLTEQRPLSAIVNSMFREKYGSSFNAVNARSFTGIYVLVDAISRAGTSDPSAIRKALIDTDIPGNKLILPWKGICFDKSGQNVLADSMLVQIFNEKPIIVWPESLAQTSAVLPVPRWSCR
jgi:ABC-type branched-chain amino acid transport systems, periplasmic component